MYQPGCAVYITLLGVTIDMPRIHSHYENLRVARNAPLGVIRAAFRVLAQQHHPDKNPSDLESVRIMALLNEAYRVLADPNLRREHDAWIERQEETSTVKHHSDGNGGNVDRERRDGRPPNAAREEAPLRDGDPKTHLSELDQEYEIFKRKFPYYLMNGAALAVLILILLGVWR